MRELQARLAESQGAEAALPAEVDDLHRRLQGDFARLQAREAGAACVPVFLRNGDIACPHSCETLAACLCTMPPCSCDGPNLLSSRPERVRMVLDVLSAEGR